MGLWGFKEQFVFFVYYFLVRYIPFGKEDLKRFLVITALIGAAIAAFGCIQAQFFGMDLLKTLGYGIEIQEAGLSYLDPNYQRRLPGGIAFVRAISILQDALSLGSYLMILLLILAVFLALYIGVFMRRAEADGLVGASRDEVWELYDDIAGTPRWVPSVREVLRPGPHATSSAPGTLES